MENTRVLRENARKMCKYPYINDSVVDGLIKEKHFWKVPGTSTMICAIVLKNGYVVFDNAACIDARNFKPDMAEKISFSKARDQVFRLAAYAYCDERLAEQEGEHGA